MEGLHLTNLDIVFDNKKKEYQTGDQLSGNLLISLKGKVLMSDIKIGITCMSEVKWVEHPGTRHHREGHVYYDRKKLWELLYQIPEEYADNSLSAGEHVIPFKLKLSEKGLPSSFVSPHGSITYYVEAIIDEKGYDHKVGTEIIVDSPFKENLELSVGGTIEKELGILNMSSGKIVFHGSVEKKGFIPGEVIQVHSLVINDSTTDVTPRVTLYQTQIYMCGERHKSLEVALTDAIVGTTVAKETENNETILVPIPKDISLSIKSSIISIKYFIHITLDIPHAIDLHLNLPIIVTNKSWLS